MDGWAVAWFGDDAGDGSQPSGTCKRRRSVLINAGTENRQKRLFCVGGRAGDLCRTALRTRAREQLSCGDGRADGRCLGRGKDTTHARVFYG